VAVVHDGEVPLDEVEEARLEVDGAGLAIPEELRLDGEPGMVRGGAPGRDDLAEIVDERGDDPGLDNTVHPFPIKGTRRGGILENMDSEREN
jgi:hypothetical protein